MERLTILVVNNHGQFNHLIHRAIRDMGQRSLLTPNTLTTDEVLAQQPNGLILGGGPDMSRQGNCGIYMRELDLPTLGICLGHQAMALTFGGEVRTGRMGGYANVDVEVLQPDRILAGFPPTVSVWASHADEVSCVPGEFDVLARSEICEVEAMRHRRRPLFGVQWHPEVSHTEGGLKVFKNFLDVCRDV